MNRRLKIIDGLTGLIEKGQMLAREGHALGDPEAHRLDAQVAFLQRLVAEAVVSTDAEFDRRHPRPSWLTRLWMRVTKSWNQRAPAPTTEPR